MTTYEIIQSLCHKNNIAVTALEKELGFGRGSIGKMKNGSPSANRLQKIADFFNVSTDYLMTGEEPFVKEKTLPNQDISPAKKQVLESIDNLTDEQVNAVSSFIRYLTENR